MVLKTRHIGSHPQQQEHVKAYFQFQSSYWQDVYTIRGVQAEIIRDRHTAILNWIDDLALAPGSQVLEIGCGAGFMAIALAQRRLHVYGIDSAEAMITLARQNAVEFGTAPAMLSFEVGDVYSLPYKDSSFDLLVAIGVLPWLDRAELAVREMARITKPGGYIILTTANRAGLASLLDPLICPVLRPLKLRVKRVFVRLGLRQQSPAMIFHSNRSVESLLRLMNLAKVKEMTRGFGFSLFRHAMLPEPLGAVLNRWLQHLADRGVFGLRSTGMAYIAMVRKSSQPPAQLTDAEEGRELAYG